MEIPILVFYFTKAGVDNGTYRVDTNGNFEWYTKTVSQAMTLTAAGNLLVGTTSATANGGDVQISKGITFPATQVACSNVNTLDDYEEGTFTPSINTTNNDLTGFSYNTQTGSSVKIGKQVTVSIEVSTINALSITGTGVVRVTGLPFSVAEVSNGGRNVLALTHDNRWTNNPSFGQIQSSDTAIKLFKNNAMNTAAALAVSDFVATNSANYNIVTFMFTYITT